MRYGLSVLTSLAWALWLGGLITLFLTVSRLFSFNRATAIEAAPQMFIVFERYQLILAATALLGSAIWRMREGRAGLTALFVLFAVTSLGAIVQSGLISPQMHRLREAGQSSGHEFMKLHGLSMLVYTSQAAVLLVAGFVLAFVMSSKRTTSALPKVQEAG